MELTDIVTKPWKEIHNGRWTLFFRANDDRIYTCNSASRIIEIDHKSLRNRLNNYHWSTPGILKKKFEPAKRDIHRKQDLSHIPAGDLEYLNDRSKGKERSWNLGKVPKPTEIEKRVYEKKAKKSRCDSDSRH